MPALPCPSATGEQHCVGIRPAAVAACGDAVTLMPAAATEAIRPVAQSWTPTVRRRSMPCPGRASTSWTATRRAALRTGPVALRGDRMRLLVAAGSAEELPGLLDWLEWASRADLGGHERHGGRCRAGRPRRAAAPRAGRGSLLGSAWDPAGPGGGRPTDGAGAALANACHRRPAAAYTWPISRWPSRRPREWSAGTRPRSLTSYRSPWPTRGSARCPGLPPAAARRLAAPPDARPPARPALHVGLEKTTELVRIGGGEIDLVRLAVQRERDGLVRLAAVEVIDKKDLNLLCHRISFHRKLEGRGSAASAVSPSPDICSTAVRRKANRFSRKNTNPWERLDRHSLSPETCAFRT